MQINYAEIELEARRLRAEMIRNVFASLFRKSEATQSASLSTAAQPA